MKTRRTEPKANVVSFLASYRLTIQTSTGIQTHLFRARNENDAWDRIAFEIPAPTGYAITRLEKIGRAILG